MCGIAGFTSLHSAAPDAEEVVRRMTRALTSRGPDGEGFHLGEGIAMGNRRLSIIDLLGGGQPMGSSNDRYKIVYNGEVYNYLELRAGLERCECALRTHSDTEVVLQQYARDGVNALMKFNGMFAFAIWDRDEGRLFLACDHMGIKPLYYCLRDGELIFASFPACELARFPRSTGPAPSRFLIVTKALQHPPHNARATLVLHVALPRDVQQRNNSLLS
jgi:asparagine synthase (glutamine-hydrolysing)